VPALDLQVFQKLSGSQSVGLLKVSVLNSVAMVFLSFGLLISLYVAWRITKTSMVSKYFLVKESIALLTCFALVVYTFLI
jgi:hypothetical protein